MKNSAATSFCFVFLLGSFVRAADRPNLIAIVTDDQGRWAMGAHGNDDVHTPNMDRIAAEGALFVNAFAVTPVCSPSRATYMTGRYPTELGITDWIAPMEADAGLGLREQTWPMVLQKAGYRTALIGKWHLGTKPEFHPTKLGFDHFMGFLDGGNKPMDPTLEVNGKRKKLKGSLPDLLVDDAVRFVRENAGRPFALCLHFRAPHLPYGPVPKEDSAIYKDLTPTVPNTKGVDPDEMRRRTRNYYASITSADRNLGRLLGLLDELKLTRNTLVIFTSDHGYNEGRHTIDTKGNGHWMAGGVRGPTRPNMWDTSIRVPMAVRWPAVVKPGMKIETRFSNLDMFRTVLGALGVPVPVGSKAHGIDCSPTLRGKSIRRTDPFFGQFDLHNSGLAYMRMIRTEKYKYVHHYKTNYMHELYDLEADPGETKNLARRQKGKYGPIIEELRAKLVTWQQSIHDPILNSSY